MNDHSPSKTNAIICKVCQQMLKLTLCEQYTHLYGVEKNKISENKENK